MIVIRLFSEQIRKRHLYDQNCKKVTKSILYYNCILSFYYRTFSLKRKIQQWFSSNEVKFEFFKILTFKF